MKQQPQTPNQALDHPETVRGTENPGEDACVEEVEPEKAKAWIGRLAGIFSQDMRTSVKAKAKGKAHRSPSFVLAWAPFDPVNVGARLMGASFCLHSLYMLHISSCASSPSCVTDKLSKHGAILQLRGVLYGRSFFWNISAPPPPAQINLPIEDDRPCRRWNGENHAAPVSSKVKSV